MEGLLNLGELFMMDATLHLSPHRPRSEGDAQICYAVFKGRSKRPFVCGVWTMATS